MVANTGVHLANFIEMLIRFASIVFWVTFATALNAQQFFDNYQPLRSSGKIPTDFLLTTQQKIEHDNQSDLTQVAKKRRNEFVNQINYSVDELLRSGEVVFGDTISAFLTSIGNRLLENNPTLRSKLRFYCYNTADANAFSTRQGIILLSTGLIAQVTSEAQLAYVLAHEIVHFEQKHVFESYKFQLKNKFTSQEEFKRLTSNYSKDNELEADKLAVKLVRDAGYNPAEILKTFDVLLYAHLPFEEIQFSPQYLATKELIIPAEFPVIKPRPISANSKYNDYLQSHPNIDKRKLFAEKEIAQFVDWKVVKNFDTLAFNFVRNISRFEFVRKKVFSNEPIEALYAIFVLEKNFPNSFFLKEMKAQAWLDVMKTTETSANFNSPYVKWISKKIVFRKKFEGQISILSQFINSVSTPAILTLGLRQIYDLYKSDSLSPVLVKIKDRAIQLVAESYEFPFESFSIENYEQGKQSLERLKEIERENAQNGTSNDKYSVIMNQSKGYSFSFRIDSTKFYLYGLSDLRLDSSFVKAYNKYKQAGLDKEAESDRFARKSDTDQQQEKRIKQQNELKLSADSILVLRPWVYSSRPNKSINVKKTLKTENMMHEAILENAKALDINAVLLDYYDTTKLNADNWNQIAQLTESVNRAIEDEKFDAFVVDIQQLKAIQQAYGIDKLLVIDYLHSYEPNLTFGNITLFTILLPVGLIYFPIELLSAHLSYWQFHVIDLNTGEIVLSRSYHANEPSSKNALGSRIFNMLHEFKRTPNE